MKESKTLIPKDNKWKYINLHSSAPSFKALIKLHKSGQPIRLVVNWHSTLAYKLSRLFMQKINSIPPLPNMFKIKNTTDLLQNLQDILMSPCYTFASLDITNLYFNIPLVETNMILTDTLK